MLRNVLLSCFLLLMVFVSVPTVGATAGSLYPLEISRHDAATVRFDVEFANTDDTMRKGLMDRHEMPKNQGMLFDYGRPVIARMWMKNTYLPLDMLFVDSQGIIRHIHAHAVPLDLSVISSPVPVRFVLEINAGQAAKRGLRVGDRLSSKELDVFAETR